jgi:hypothetical protein
MREIPFLLSNSTICVMEREMEIRSQGKMRSGDRIVLLLGSADSNPICGIFWKKEVHRVERLGLPPFPSLGQYHIRLFQNPGIGGGARPDPTNK